VALGVVALIVVLAVNLMGSSATTADSLNVPPQQTPLNLAHDRSLGKANAPVKLDEWEDLQCPSCRNYTENVQPRIVDRYVTSGQVEIVFHDFSFIGPESDQAAVAARCAGDQGQFWAYKEYLYSNQGAENSGTFNKQLFDAIATKLGLDLGKFDQCLNDPAKLDAVRTETAQGTQLGVNATPTLYINGQKAIDASFDAVSQQIDQALKGQPATGASSAPASATPAASPTP
jgi:protein-disulfide isomerase